MVDERAHSRGRHPAVASGQVGREASAPQALSEIVEDGLVDVEAPRARVPAELGLHVPSSPESKASSASESSRSRR
ncbi:hypothetical protein GALLR39Z86_38810 [Glycomyces algeriensis]|uniref:Uncharacterized protein n=1 Tax=Glycomyces algeriensis TaxID=256037 RepID=A0A9W6GBK7_9ACTN|nr:hypothetical protein GALLR39Z86_38810 [Glycomyces algeriensis]